MNVDEEINSLLDKCEAAQTKIKWLIKHRSKLVDLPAFGASGIDQLDFDNLSHKQVIGVIRAMGGKWKKTPSPNASNRINYETEIDGIAVRCWQGEPPPSCKLIEVEEHVPEQVIPAHTVKRMKMSCHPELPAVIATAQAKAVAL